MSSGFQYESLYDLPLDELTEVISLVTEAIKKKGIS